MFILFLHQILYFNAFKNYKIHLEPETKKKNLKIFFRFRNYYSM